MKKLNQIGDTIVEVLIALTILAMAVGTAYAISSKSIKSAQQAQERTQASKLVEGQIDTLKYLSESQDTVDVAVFAEAKNFSNGAHCINSTTTDGQTTITAVKLTDADPNISGLCKIDDRFNISFTYDSDNRIFSVRADWDSLGSSTQESVVMEYRVVQ
jgi:Tfp pilus assembly protein PilV